HTHRLVEGEHHLLEPAVSETFDGRRLGLGQRRVEPDRPCLEDSERDGHQDVTARLHRAVGEMDVDTTGTDHHVGDHGPHPHFETGDEATDDAGVTTHREVA